MGAAHQLCTRHADKSLDVLRLDLEDVAENSQSIVVTLLLYQQRRKVIAGFDVVRPNLECATVGKLGFLLLLLVAQRRSHIVVGFRVILAQFNGTFVLTESGLGVTQSTKR